jgi:RNA polymerase-interacting CarD/CdnL/TRCF family regulator
MNFHIGDPVMHWMYGLGQVVGIEVRAIAGQKNLYYKVSIRDLTVWVPADNQSESRLRTPTTKDGFKELFSILAGVAEPLPLDRQERKVWLQGKLKDGRAASLCHALRDLATFNQSHTVNFNDGSLMKRLREVLLGEWSYALAVPIPVAEGQLSQMLASGMDSRTKK